MKILFLDCDGVLNDGFKERAYLIERCLRYLKYIIAETDAHIVLSSNWRLFAEYKNVLFPALRQYGIIEKDVHSSTPDLDLDHLPMRPREILQWIRDNTRICPWKEKQDDDLPAISNFVIIDDRDLLSELYGQALSGRFVKTEGNIGLTLREAQKAIAILNGYSEAACLTTWALSHWGVFEEFDNVIYVPIGLHSLRIVDNRKTPGKPCMPLHYFQQNVLDTIVSFLSNSDRSAVCQLSRKWNISNNN